MTGAGPVAVVADGPGAGVPRAVLASWRDALAGALAETLMRPAGWVPALAGFLVRGGILPFAMPIVVLPTTVGVATFFGPELSTVVLGGPPPDLLTLFAVVVGGTLAWLLLSALIGAAADVALIRTAVQDAGADLPRRGWLTVRVAIVRLVCHLPLVLALAAGLGTLIAAAYHELILPDELVTPILLRVIREVPVQVGAIVGAWLLGETLGGLAARAVVLDDRPMPIAVGLGLWWLLRRPVTSAGTLVIGLLATVALVAPALLAVGSIWARLREVIAAGGRPEAVLAGTALLAGTWIGGLGLAGIAAALRSHLWTLDVLRARAARSTEGPTEAGGFSGDRRSVTLWRLRRR